LDILGELNVQIERRPIQLTGMPYYAGNPQGENAFYQKIVQKCRHEKGERIMIKKELIKGQLPLLLAKVKKEKDTIEERIATANFNTNVDFDPEKILSRYRTLTNLGELLFIAFSLIGTSTPTQKRVSKTRCPIKPKNLR
jgi:hypothetical protein